MDIEQRLLKLECQNRNQRVALMLLTVALCALVAIAATGSKDGDFDSIIAKKIKVINDNGRPVVSLYPLGGHGYISAISSEGKELVGLGIGNYDNGLIDIYSNTGKKSTLFAET